MLRVVFVTDIITPYMVAVLEALDDLTDLNVLFCSRTGTRAGDWTLDRQPRFQYRIAGGPAIRRRGPDATDFYPSPSIARHIAAARPDVVIVGGFSFPALYAAAHCLRTRARLVVHSDGTSESEARLNVLQRASRALVLRIASACVGNSELAARRFVELGFPPERVFVAHHTTRIEPFWEVARSRRYSRSRSLRLIAVGRLIPRKGVDALLLAVGRARRQEPSIDLVVVGSGPEEARLRALAAEAGAGEVWFRGFVDQPELPSVLADGDAFAFPTRDDPFGIALLEAAASGLPLVASPHGGATWELVGPGESGFIVEPDDLEAHSEALVRLARDPALRERMGRAAHERTLGRTPRAAAERYHQAVTAALSGAPRGVRKR